MNGAKIGNGGLYYDDEFLAWLKDKDTNWDQQEGLE